MARGHQTVNTNVTLWVFGALLGLQLIQTEDETDRKRPESVTNTAVCCDLSVTLQRYISLPLLHTFRYNTHTNTHRDYMVFCFCCSFNLVWVEVQRYLQPCACSCLCSDLGCLLVCLKVSGGWLECIFRASRPSQAPPEADLWVGRAAGGLRKASEKHTPGYRFSSHALSLWDKLTYNFLQAGLRTSISHYWSQSKSVLLLFPVHPVKISEISYAYRLMTTVDTVKFLSCSKHCAKKILQTK